MKYFLFGFLATIGVDQLSKYLAHDVILNTGISFGFFSGSLLTIALIFVLIGIVFQFGKTFFQASPVAAGIFFGGSISNVLDRIFYGGVRDFLPVPILGIRNNLADWCIILSILWIFLLLKPASFLKTTHS
ncbi:MAG: signal peptidase II [Candidatus Woesebacteria bacterium]